MLERLLGIIVITLADQGCDLGYLGVARLLTELRPLCEGFEAGRQTIREREDLEQACRNAATWFGAKEDVDAALRLARQNGATVLEQRLVGCFILPVSYTD